MQIKNEIDFKKYKRFFAIGCSFTNYWWSTWADIIGYHFDEYYNVGKPGAGNQYIATMVSEIDQKYNLNSNDLVICMWSSITREDRYKDNRWEVGGNVHTSYIFNNKSDKQFIKKWYDERFYLIRDLSQINLTKNLLENKNVDWDFLSVINLTKNEDGIEIEDSLSDITYHYESLIDIIKPSVYSSIFNSSWDYQGKYQDDTHPTPIHHLEYLKFLYKNFNDKDLSELILDETKSIFEEQRTEKFSNLDYYKKVSKSKEFIWL